MVKLDATLLRYMTRDDFRALTSVEMGMKNHELVPKSLINSISSLRNGSISKILLHLTQNKLISYERGKRFDGYRLTYGGYDYLALNVLSNRTVISSIGNQIGVGKESDVYIASDQKGRQFAVKFHRLGRTCFRKVSEKRDYNRSGHKTNWIYLSRLAALREFAFMKVLYENKFISIPEPIDCNRHCLVMELIDGVLLNHISKEQMSDEKDVQILYEKLMNVIISLANDFGLIHGDFNEFNIIIKSGTLEPVLIDFPQMISVSHSSAQTYFDRDVKCIVEFFVKRFNYESEFRPCFETVDKENCEKLKQINDIVEEIDDQNKDIDIDLKHIESSAQDIPLESSSTFDPNIEILNENKVIDSIERLELAIDSDSKLSDNEDNHSNDLSDRAVSSVASTFTTQQIKDKLNRERKIRENRIKAKKANKNTKGDSNAFRRRRKDDLATVNDDLKAYHYDDYQPDFY